MDVCKNKNTGKYFVFINYLSNDKVLLVNPLGRIIPLSLSNFGEVEDQDDKYLDPEQVQKYYKHEKNRSEDNSEKAMYTLEDLSQDSLKKLYKKCLDIHEAGQRK